MKVVQFQTVPSSHYAAVQGFLEPVDTRALPFLASIIFRAKPSCLVREHACPKNNAG